MDTAEKIAELLVHGATIALLGDFKTELSLAEARMLTSPTRLRWCATFPVDQHHVHTTEYDRAEIVYDRDVAFYQGDAMVCYIVPWEESSLVLDDVRATLAAWKALISDKGYKARFDRFFDEA